MGLLTNMMGKLNRVVNTGGKFIKLDMVTALDDLSPTAGSWIDVDLSAWVPINCLSVSCSIVFTNSGIDTYAALADSGNKIIYQISAWGASESTYPTSSSGVIGVTNQKISYYTNRNAFTYFRIFIFGYWVPMTEDGA